jgi:hypothetical protein
LTQPGLEPAIYRTRGEHANIFTTDAVKKNARVKAKPINMIFDQNNIG